MARKSIRKAGTRRGEPHYSVECIGCPLSYGTDSVIAIGQLSKDAAERRWAEHTTQH